MQDTAIDNNADYSQLLEMNIVVSKYKNRYWAVYLDDQLIVVTVYKKGAVQIQKLFELLTGGQVKLSEFTPRFST